MCHWFWGVISRERGCHAHAGVGMFLCHWQLAASAPLLSILCFPSSILYPSPLPPRPPAPPPAPPSSAPPPPTHPYIASPPSAPASAAQRISLAAESTAESPPAK